MANEAAIAVEKVARVKKECHDLEETAEDLFSGLPMDPNLQQL